MDPDHDWLGLSEVHVLGEHIQEQAVLRPKDAVRDLGKGQGLDTLQLVIRKWVIYDDKHLEIFMQNLMKAKNFLHFVEDLRKNCLDLFSFLVSKLGGFVVTVVVISNRGLESKIIMAFLFE